ncbi:organic hydroperoxide resistance protein [Afifella marina]|uniref:Peroxiredoxin, Ohr subfamily n=1 Tax=Afifella marina DSM 2698 TaxID=1120955 RepID=A0A1G5N1F9_AFIMA|nr:organic hydroperoxide resistance protein [Afifella marina]MBK1622304.1 organic hydroperoxide resistance protein [Afifella marina DSM 2698]MBK1626982.1 organic hydroperoxide resistance protein [Afifella marina]MBK5919088.1 organic hydroperoxide resistance protein [Afifella marina]RAI20179.1 organic hydroperoxide resistance protein [Afifella marina DSM 2698]SCZ31193.1 peroxiredoxin, Ohr subfamily [Afifella marina DSM 2698]
MKVMYETEARAVGGRQGHAETPDHLLSVDLATPKEMGGKGGATNPEQLFAAGYAACFESAMRFLAGKKKLPLKGASVTVKVRLGAASETAFGLDVDLIAETEGLDRTAAEDLVASAHEACPYSRAIKGNVNVAITVEAK